MAELPFSAGKEAFLSALSQHRTAVVQAPPGTGKTTLAPIYTREFLRDQQLSQFSATGNQQNIASQLTPRVLVTQPRRIAARAAATRLAELYGWNLGSTVGYTIRGELQTNAETEIEFMTSGVLLRRLLRDPDLPGVGAIIIDEIHERHVESDLIFGMLAQLRELREDLVVVAMSATVDAQRFATALNAPIVDVPNPIHPLEIHHSTSEHSIAQRDPRAHPGATGSVEDFVFRRIIEALEATDSNSSSPGDLLAFVPTIRGTELLAERLNGKIIGHFHIFAMPLHGSLSPAAQSRVIAPVREFEAPTRRVIIATDVAESSLTVPGVRVVVDSCLSRVSRQDSSRGMSQLVTESASRASTIQRAGRAGREGPGQVFRCLTAEQWSHLSAFSPPAILTSDLTSALLDCAVWGAPGGVDLPLPDSFPELPARAATEALVRLGALTAPTDSHPFGQVTPLGTVLAGMPVDPHLARGGLLASRLVDVDLVAKVLFLLDATPDPSTPLIKQVKSLRSQDQGVRRMRRIVEQHRSRRTLEYLLPEISLNSAPDFTATMSSDTAIGLTVACCFPQLIARRVVDANGELTDRVLTVGGTGAQLSRELLATSQPSGKGGESQWCAVADIARAHTRDGTGARVRSAVWIPEEIAVWAGGGVEKKRTATYSPETRKIKAREVRQLGAIQLSQASAQATKEEAHLAVRKALAEHGASAIPMSQGASSLLRRVQFLHRQGVEGYPDVSGELPEEVSSFAAEDLVAGRTPDIAGLLRGVLPWNQPIDELAPEHVELPSGRRAKITYPPVDEAGPPVVATKLQDAFGLFSSPEIAGVPVQFHLLSPAGRPLAVTDDLQSFWAGPYQGVRKDMRGRYPKHKWPEDPAAEFG